MKKERTSEIFLQLSRVLDTYVANRELTKCETLPRCDELVFSLPQPGMCDVRLYVHVHTISVLFRGSLSMLICPKCFSDFLAISSGVM